MPRKKRRGDRDGLYERPNSPYYWVSYIDANGERVRRSTGVRKTAEGRKEAEALLAKWRLEVHKTRRWEEQPPRSFEELMVTYLKAHEHKRSARSDRYRTANLRKMFQGTIVNELRPADVRAYIVMRREEGVSNSTINRETALLSAAINWANRELDWELPNPAAGRKLKEPEGRVRWISHGEAENLVQQARKDDQAGQWLPAFIILGLHTGCRTQELLGLVWDRVDLEADSIYLEGRHTKSGKRRTVPLNRSARQALLERAGFRAQWCPDSPWVFCDRKGKRIKSIRRSFLTACKNAGIEDFHPHDLRHTCAAWLVSAGVPLPEVRDLLGHASIVMTERYAHLAPERVRAAVRVLDEAPSHFSHTGEK